RAVKPKIRRQHERAAMVRVIAFEQVGHRRLWGCRLQGRMRIDHAFRSEKSRVRNTPNSRLAIVVRDILQQPFDGVVQIAAVIHIILRFLVVDVRPHLYERAFGHEPPAHVLHTKIYPALSKSGEGPSWVRYWSTPY